MRRERRRRFHLLAQRVAHRLERLAGRGALTLAATTLTPLTTDRLIDAAT